MVRRHTNTKIETFPPISFAFIFFLEKTESRLGRYVKSINFQGAKKQTTMLLCFRFIETDTAETDKMRNLFINVTSKVVYFT